MLYSRPVRREHQTHLDVLLQYRIVECWGRGRGRTVLLSPSTLACVEHIGLFSVAFGVFVIMCRWECFFELRPALRI